MDDANEKIIRQLREAQALARLIGDAPSFREVIAMLPAAARSDGAVLITGETGTGKELVARAIHYVSPRVAQPFVAVNCGSLTDTLLEDELFGHEPGAFTDGALDPVVPDAGRSGRREHRDRGTARAREATRKTAPRPAIEDAPRCDHSDRRRMVMTGVADRIVAGSWTFRGLETPKRRPRCRAFGFWGGDPFGSAEGMRTGSVPQLWVAGGPVDIQVKGLEGLSLHQGSGEAVMGSSAVEGRGRAVLLTRQGTAVAVTHLHPNAYDVSWGMAAADGQQVGYGTPVGSHLSAALLWAGSAESVVELRGPDPGRQSQATAVAGGVQVGSAATERGHHAMLWRGRSETVVDLHPGKGFASGCHGAGDGEAVGAVWLNMEVSRPALWRGSAESFVDLTPQKYHGGSLFACARGFQIGEAMTDKKGKFPHAGVWAGSPGDFVDLHSLVPAEDFNISRAMAIHIDGNRLRVAGEVGLTKGDVLHTLQAAVWEAEMRG